MEPVIALQQAIHYLDRELAPGQKVRAFQRAIDVVVEAGPEEIAARAEAGTLTDLDGIGTSTARWWGRSPPGRLLPRSSRRVSRT